MRAPDEKKPSGAAAQEGPKQRIFELVSDDLAPKSRAQALRRQGAAEVGCNILDAAWHGATLFDVRDYSRERRLNKSMELPCQLHF